jgi:hypothetical protein
MSGGQADHFYPLLWRFSPGDMVKEGFEWGKDLPFSRLYGRIQTTIRTTVTPGGGVYESRNSQSMRKDKDGQPMDRVIPGIMPALFGRHLLDKTIFLSLADMSEGLPKYREYVGGGPDAGYDEQDHFFHHDCRISLEGELDIEYARIEKILSDKCNDLMRKGSMKLLGAMLNTVLCYSDQPFGWVAPTGNPADAAVGYWEDHKGGTWRGVVQPDDLPEEFIYPKEQALLDICKREIGQGNQVWVYCTMTDKRDVQPRLKRLLEEIGLRVGILRANTVKPRKRLTWIAEQGPKVDVVLSHAELVKTGVDFFGRNPAGGFAFNFNCIVFYETGYSLFTLRQAARRAWRLGQARDCRTYYLHYQGTMQQRAIQLMARKMGAAMAIDGQLNMEGLSAMDDDGSAAMQLARSISESIDEADIQRNWAKVQAMPAARPIDPDSAWRKLGLEEFEGITVEDLDFMNMETALIAQTLLDNDVDLSKDTLAKMAAELFDYDLLLADV